MPVTKEQVVAGIQVVKALADAIKELGSVPSGHLYASVMGRLSLSQYEQCIGILTRAGIVRKSGDLLIWSLEEKS